MFFLFICFGTGLQAQVSNPVVKKGMVFSYSFELHGQHVPFDLTLKSMTDTLTLGWRIRGYVAGTYKVTPSSLMNADKLNFSQPAPNATVVLPADETFLMLSKKAFSALISSQQYFYDNTVYELIKGDNLLKTGDLTLKTVHVKAQDEATELWILNNPDFPLICQIKGNPLGINVLLKSIK